MWVEMRGEAFGISQKLNKNSKLWQVTGGGGSHLRTRLLLSLLAGKKAGKIAFEQGRLKEGNGAIDS